MIGVASFRDNDPRHFSSLHVAMLTLFRCATMDDWSDLMYINMYGCDRYGYDGSFSDECTQPTAHPKLALAYFCTFVILAALCILNLFVGVILGSMAVRGPQRKGRPPVLPRRPHPAQEARADLEEELMVQKKLKEQQAAKRAHKARQKALDAAAEDGDGSTGGGADGSSQVGPPRHGYTRLARLLTGPRRRAGPPLRRAWAPLAPATQGVAVAWAPRSRARMDGVGSSPRCGG